MAFGIAIFEYSGNKKNKVFNEAPDNVDDAMRKLSKMGKDMELAGIELRKRLKNRRYMSALLAATFSYATIMQTVIVL